jgi:hypothetical protein
LLHVGHGPAHIDLILGHGATCPTLRLHGRQWRWQPAHRRRYLAWQGPVAGHRGVVRRLWQGRVRLLRHALGWRIAGDAQALLRRDGVVVAIGRPCCRPWPWRTPA